MDDRGDEIDRATARLLARLEEWLEQPGAIEESLALLGPERLGPALAWLATRPDAELERWGVELTEDDRLELVAWTIELARRP
jgi:hypothetical protein